jgi:hypothetical protein
MRRVFPIPTRLRGNKSHPGWSARSIYRTMVPGVSLSSKRLAAFAFLKMASYCPRHFLTSTIV